MTERLFEIAAERENGARLSSLSDSLSAAKAQAVALFDADLDGDCYVAVEVVEILRERRIRCWRETRRGSALELRRLLLAKRRDSA